MALELNGSTGVSLVQDGVVTAADLASTLDLTGKTVTLPAGVGGKVLQVVQATSQSTDNYASVNFQQASLSISITPVSSTSKFLIKAVVYGGVANHDTAVSMNFYDSLNGATSPIAPNNTTGGDNNGSSGNRMSAYFGITSWAANSTVDDWFIGLAAGEYLYTPAYQNTTARTFGLLVRTSLGYNFRLNMNGQNNSADPRDMRIRSSITVMEIAA